MGPHDRFDLHGGAPDINLQGNIYYFSMHIRDNNLKCIRILCKHRRARIFYDTFGYLFISQAIIIQNYVHKIETPYPKHF